MTQSFVCWCLVLPCNQFLESPVSPENTPWDILVEACVIAFHIVCMKIISCCAKYTRITLINAKVWFACCSWYIDINEWHLYPCNCPMSSESYVFVRHPEQSSRIYIFFFFTSVNNCKSFPLLIQLADVLQLF